MAALSTSCAYTNSCYQYFVRFYMAYNFVTYCFNRNCKKKSDIKNIKKKKKRKFLL